ncbi:MAG: PAC2 family protein [Actinomycetota bacterium]|nr:PAC2 family protein [Actinomycetota bacterium]
MDTVFVVSFEGDDDAVCSGKIAVSLLRELLSAKVCGELRVDKYLDEGSVQPSIEVGKGLDRSLVWPRVLLYMAEIPSIGKRIYLASIPPVKRSWGSFCDEVAEMIAGVKPDAVVLLGSIVAMDRIPHFGRILVRSNSPVLMRRYGLFKDNCGGFTGSLGAVHVILEGRQLPAVSMWLTTPIASAHEADVNGALELIEAIEKMFDFKVRDVEMRLDPANVFASGAIELNELEGRATVDLWASQVDFLDLQDLVDDFPMRSRELIEEAEEYLRYIEG